MGWLSSLFGWKSAKESSDTPAPKPKPKARGPLTPEGLLPSDLWLDQPNAHELIDQKVDDGSLTKERAERLHHFVEHGYCTFTIDLDTATCEEIQADINRAWREKPDNLAYAYHSGLKLFPLSDEATERKPSYRIADLHSYSEAARRIFLHREIHEHIGLILDEPVVATQSLSFEWGSQQELHRDPIHVVMNPPSHLAAAWVALEDLDPKCGPLTYVPGSHRLPYYQFPNGDYRFNPNLFGNEEIQAGARFDAEQCQAAGFERLPFAAKRGEVLIWHHSLLHGGSYPEDPELTRRSFVIHFTSKANYPELRQTVTFPGENGGEATTRVVGTKQTLSEDGCIGFDNPLRHI